MYGSVHITSDPGPGGASLAEGGRRLRSRGPRMRPRLVHLLVFLLLCLGGVARAQSDEPGPVQHELERTDRAIERARGHFADHPCVRGAALLRRGSDLQARAWDAFRAASLPRRREALVLTHQARKLVIESLQACPSADHSDTAVRDLLQRTEELARSLDAALQSRNDLEARRLLEAGREQLSRARDAYRDGEFRRSLRLLTIARALLQRASEAGPASAGVEARGPLLFLDRTELVLSEARLAVEGRETSRAAELLALAESHQLRARDWAAEGRPLLALRATQLARSLALEAQWSADAERGSAASDDPEEVRATIEALEQMLAEQAPRTSGGPVEAQAFLDAARDELARARDLLAAGKQSAAMAAAKAAASLLRRGLEQGQAP